MSKITALTVPKWGLSMEEGTLVKWLVNEGDNVNQGDGVAELESSKIVNTLESHVSGIVYRKLAREDETLPVGSLLAVVAESGVTVAEIEAYINNFTSESRATISGDLGRTAPAPATAKETDSAAQPASTSIAGSMVGAKDFSPLLAGSPIFKPEEVPNCLKHGPDDQDVPAAPHARRLAQKLGINLHNITGSGRHGRIAIADIEQAIARGSLATPAVVVEVPLSGTRLTIARRLQESKSTIPHYRLIADIRVDALNALRTQMTASLNQDLSLNDMLLKACATALLKAPACNVQLENNIIRKFTDADIAVAVALESGLITPIIRSVNSKGIAQIASEARDLIARAKAGRLSLEEISGGTFTISNLGMFGIRQFDAIINPPQCAILAVGCAEQRVVVESGMPAVATVMSVSLSLDHRVIDGAVGAGFLRELVQIIEHPESGAFI